MSTRGVGSSLKLGQQMGRGLGAVFPLLTGVGFEEGAVLSRPRQKKIVIFYSKLHVVVHSNALC